jgi:hypothetical protein
VRWAFYGKSTANADLAARVWHYDYRRFASIPLFVFVKGFILGDGLMLDTKNPSARSGKSGLAANSTTGEPADKRKYTVIVVNRPRGRVPPRQPLSEAGLQGQTFCLHDALRAHSILAAQGGINATNYQERRAAFTASSTTRWKGRRLPTQSQCLPPCGLTASTSSILCVAGHPNSARVWSYLANHRLRRRVLAHLLRAQ